MIVKLRMALVITLVLFCSSWKVYGNQQPRFDHLVPDKDKSCLYDTGLFTVFNLSKPKILFQFKDIDWMGESSLTGLISEGQYLVAYFRPEKGPNPEIAEIASFDKKLILQTAEYLKRMLAEARDWSDPDQYEYVKYNTVDGPTYVYVKVGSGGDLMCGHFFDRTNGKNLAKVLSLYNMYGRYLNKPDDRIYENEIRRLLTATIEK